MNKTSIGTQLNRLDIDRLRGYRELLDFYYGRQWQGRERWGEKRLTFNYTKVFIDKVTSYLMSGVNFAVDAVEDSDKARDRARSAEAALRQVYEDNNLEQLEDRNIDSVAKAEEKGEAYLRGAEVEAVNGSILIPVNCGQQLYDVIDIADSRAGLDAARRRVLGLTLVYSPKRGEYRQRLLLGGV
jgi:hypothetical protein